MSNLSFLNKKKSLLSLGIMNGTSLDGIDFVLIRSFKKGGCEFIQEKDFKFPSALKNKLMRATQHLLKVDELAELHHELGRYYAQCFKKLPARMKKCDVIGLHGQTVYHAGSKSTLQIGEGSYLAAISQKIVVQDFRVADIAVGGQGAPLATIIHENLIANKKKIAVHNLGGISNTTLIENHKALQSFDTGPANMLLDLNIQKATRNKKSFDFNGALAKQGQSDKKLVERLMKHKYFAKRPPKSCGREEFGQIFYKKFLQSSKNLSWLDRQATLNDLTAQSIVHAYTKHAKIRPTEIIFCGGGANNGFLLKTISNYLPQIKISTINQYGWTASSIEGAAFALLAAKRIWNQPANLPKTTGAKRTVLLGKIIEL